MGETKGVEKKAKKEEKEGKAKGGKKEDGKKKKDEKKAEKGKKKAALIGGSSPVLPAAGRPLQLKTEAQKHAHFGCANACRPSPVESSCVTACETEWSQC